MSLRVKVLAAIGAMLIALMALLFHLSFAIVIQGFSYWTLQSHGLPREDIEAALRHPIDVVIPFASEPLVDAINTGVPPVIKPSEEPLTILFKERMF